MLYVNYTSISKKEGVISKVVDSIELGGIIISFYDRIMFQEKSEQNLIMKINREGCKVLHMIIAKEKEIDGIHSQGKDQ